jgi:hypothetical protein
MYLWWRVEHTWRHGEEIFHIVPQLNEHGDDAKGLGTGFGGKALGHLLLDHTSATGDVVLEVEHLEKYLRRDIIGVIAREDKLATIKGAIKMHLQKIVGYDIVFKVGICAAQILHTLRIQLHHLQWARLLHQILSHHSHTGSYLQYGEVGTHIYGVGYATSYAKVGQKMLSEKLFRFYKRHI